MRPFAKIFNGLKRGAFIKKEDVQPSALARIQEGAKASCNFPEELEPFLEAFWRPFLHNSRKKGS